jgi:hypothetical protein
VLEHRRPAHPHLPAAHRLYPELFLAEQLLDLPGSPRRAQRDRPRPRRLDVLDLIRQVNEPVLGLRLEIAYQLGYAEHNLPSASYQYDHRIVDSLDWVASVAYTLEAEGFADQILRVLSDGQDALLPAVPRPTSRLRWLPHNRRAVILRLVLRLACPRIGVVSVAPTSGAIIPAPARCLPG